MSRTPFVLGALAGFLALAGCSSSTDDSTDGCGCGAPDVVETDEGYYLDTIADLRPADEGADVPSDPDAIDDAGVDAGTDEGWEIVVPPVPFGAENRGYVEERGIVHLHSRYSHDGCYGGKDEDRPGEEYFDQCQDELRRAPCESGVSFMMLTDHPSNARLQTFEDQVQYFEDKGDEIIYDGQGRPFANRITCPEGSLVDHAYFFAGTEGSKQMPVGLAGPIPDLIFNQNVADEANLEDAQAAIASVHEQDGLAFVCHPEQSDLSVERIVALPLDGIEIFNFHPALMQALTSFDLLLMLDRFMGDPETSADPDLAILPFLKPIENDRKKFDAAGQSIRLTLFGATDIHRNVDIPSLCTDVDNCFADPAEYPNFMQLLVDGGPAVMSDGERMDGYTRCFRWMANHVYVDAAAVSSETPADLPAAMRTATGAGRGFAAFDMLGAPSGFDFFAVKDDAVVEMGSEIAGADGVTLYIRAPTLSLPAWGYGGTVDPAEARMVTKLFRANDQGTEMVMEAPGQGRTLSYTVDGPGVYRVEVWVTPRHLVPVLKRVETLAEDDYPFVYSNAFFVRP